MRLGRVGLLLAVLSAWPVDVRADILIAPFAGGAFAGQTALPLFNAPDPSVALSKSLVIGVAALWIGPGIVGVEGEVASAPGFFELADGGQAFVSSNFTTVSGSLIVTAPLGLTRESLRPYVAGGLGLMHIGLEDRLNVSPISPVDRNLLGLNLGGGAIGMLNNRAGIRFDLRHVRSIRDDEVPSTTAQSRVRLSYWRATVGVTIRY
jgi:hypothetical protein